MESTQSLKDVINQLKTAVNTYTVISDDAYDYFKKETGKFAGNLFCDLVINELNGVYETVAQVYYDPQYEDSIVIESGAKLVNLLRHLEELKAFKENNTIKYLPSIEATEKELISYLSGRGLSRTRVVA